MTSRTLLTSSTLCLHNALEGELLLVPITFNTRKDILAFGPQ